MTMFRVDEYVKVLHLLALMRLINFVVRCFYYKRSHYSFFKLNALLHLLKITLTACVLNLFSGWVFALTPANTDISSTTTATYTLNGNPASASASVTFTVQEIIDVSLSNITGASNIPVLSPDTNKFAAFTLSNSGNGEEAYSLSAINLGGDDFDFNTPVDVSIYLETNQSAGFQINEDILYNGTNNPVLAAETTRDVYVVVNVPSGLIAGDIGQLQLEAASTTPNAANALPGTALAGEGEGGTDAIVGSSSAVASEIVAFEVTTFVVNLNKVVAAVVDPFDGVLPLGSFRFIPGSEVTYEISVEVPNGTANDLRIVDPIPTNTSYKSNSIEINGNAKTDGAGDDEADFNVTQTNAVNVDFGNITGPFLANIKFTVIVD